MAEGKPSATDMIRLMSIVRATSSLTCYSCLDNETYYGGMEGRAVSMGFSLGTLLLCHECVQALKGAIAKAEGRDD